MYVHVQRLLVFELPGYRVCPVGERVGDLEVDLGRRRVRRAVPARTLEGLAGWRGEVALRC